MVNIRGVAQSGLERTPWAREATGSNPVTPTTFYGQKFKYRLEKH